MIDEDEKATLAECERSEAEYISRLGRAFGEQS